MEGMDGGRGRRWKAGWRCRGSLGHVRKGRGVLRRGGGGRGRRMKVTGQWPKSRRGRSKRDWGAGLPARPNSQHLIAQPSPSPQP